MVARFSPGNVLVRSTSIPDHREDWTACGTACLKSSIANDTFIFGFRAGATEDYVLLGIGFGDPASVLKLQINGTPVSSTFAPQLDVPFRWAVVHDADTFYLYVNDALVASQLFVTSGDEPATWFGIATTSTGGSDSANVEVGWFKVFASALSAAERATEGRSPRVLRGGSPYGCYPMASGATAGTDSSGNGNHMTAVGSPADASPHGYAATLEDPDCSTITWDVYSPDPLTSGAHFLGEPAGRCTEDEQQVLLVWKDPPATDTGAEATAGTRLHGAMVNYSGNSVQGFDNKETLVGYSDAVNIGRDLVVTGPVDVSPGSRAYRSVGGVISNALGSVADEAVDRFGLLTIYRHDTPFTDGQSLVPGYAGATADPDLYVFDDILQARLPNYPLSSSVFTAPNIAEWTQNVRRTSGPDSAAGGGARSIMARLHWGAYYQPHSRSLSAAACMLMSTHRNDTITAAIVQYGIHVQAFVRNGMHFAGNPGHTTGRLEGLLLAAILLDRQDWIDGAIWSAPGVKRIWGSHVQQFRIYRMRSATTSSIGTSPAPFQYGDLCTISTGGTCRWRGNAAGGVVWFSQETGGTVTNGVTLTGPDGQTATVNGTPSASVLHYGEGDYDANPEYEGRPEYHRVAWENGQWGNGSNRPAIGSDITWTIPYRRGEDSSLFGARIALRELLTTYATNGLADFGGADHEAIFDYIPRYRSVELTGGPEPPSDPESVWPPGERAISPPEEELFLASWVDNPVDVEATGPLPSLTIGAPTGTASSGAVATGALPSMAFGAPTGTATAGEPPGDGAPLFRARARMRSRSFTVVI